LQGHTSLNGGIQSSLMFFALAFLRRFRPSDDDAEVI
jgi:hypothetical protein